MAGTEPGAAAAAANAEEIDIDEEEDELEDAGDGDDRGSNDSAAAQLVAEESMFAPVEIHNFDPTGRGRPESDGGTSAVPEAIANVFRQ